MKKPLNNFAFVLGMLALAYALLIIPDIREVLRQPQMIRSPSSINYIESFVSRDILGLLRGTVLGSGMLMGLAVLVELVDRIRWNALTPEERAKR